MGPGGRLFYFWPCVASVASRAAHKGGVPGLKRSSGHISTGLSVDGAPSRRRQHRGSAPEDRRRDGPVGGDLPVDHTLPGAGQTDGPLKASPGDRPRQTGACADSPAVSGRNGCLCSAVTPVLHRRHGAAGQGYPVGRGGWVWGRGGGPQDPGGLPRVSLTLWMTCWF